jgi:copper chaperone CopZ
MSAAPSAETTERMDLPVSGMSCAACARAIENQLAATAGVASAHVNFATSTATVEFDPARAAVRNLVDAIEELGYGVPQPVAGEDVGSRRASTNTPRCSEGCGWRRPLRFRWWCWACGRGSCISPR